MKMKRFIITIVCFATLLSMTAAAASSVDVSPANPNIDAALTIEAYGQNESAYEASITAPKTDNDDNIIDLLDSAAVYRPDVVAGSIITA